MRSYEGQTHRTCEQRVVVPFASRQSQSVAVADDRLVADYHTCKVGNKVALAFCIVEGNDAVVGTYRRLNGDCNTCVVGNTRCSVARKLVVERCSAREGEIDISCVVVADIVCSILDSYDRFGVNGNLEGSRASPTLGYDTCVAVSGMACLSSAAIGSVGEGNISCNSLCIAQIVR